MDLRAGTEIGRTITTAYCCATSFTRSVRKDELMINPISPMYWRKRDARKRFKQAVSEGRTAAYIAQTNSSRSSQRFSVSLNLEPLCKVNFILSYEELLTRK
ncbi:unnamed protein product, partial [Timema podura]|nr:unnamed protein product [Timema podura]